MPTILVIDDNPTVATALEVLFSLHDLHTIGAESPQVGLAVLGPALRASLIPPAIATRSV